MEIKIVTRQNIWQEAFDQFGSPSFLQSWEWGELQKTLGYQVFRLGLYQKSNLLAAAQTILVSAKRGNFLFIPHGPLSHLEPKKYLSYLKRELIMMAKKYHCSFIRIAPIQINSLDNLKQFKDLGFKKAPIYMHAERLWILPLDKSEDELLNQMRKTTRYLIRKAGRDGVVIEKRTDKKAVDDFYKVYEETARREKFIPFSKNYIKNEFEVFNKTNNAIFLFGKLTGPVSIFFPPVLENSCALSGSLKSRHPSKSQYFVSALILFTKSSAFYHQGASIHTKYPAPHLMQWEAIKEAKKRGCQLYNFWGIHHPGRTPKSWTGLTLFKTGFGGEQIDYLPTQDYVISPKYYLIYLYEKLLGWKRRV